MQTYKGNTEIKLFENLVDTPHQVVTHLVLRAGQKIPEHAVNYDVIVVPIKGRVYFSAGADRQEIYPGCIVKLIPQETHHLEALEASELMVIKSVLAQ